MKSLRYVRPLDLSLWLPVDLRPVSRDFVAIVEEVMRGYRRLEGRFPWDEMNFEEKKRVTSALRRILPEGLATNVIWTANHRTIRWAIEMRTDPSAEIEIRKVFGSVAELIIRYCMGTSGRGLLVTALSSTSLSSRKSDATRTRSRLDSGLKRLDSQFVS